MSKPIVLICSVALELDPLLPFLTRRAPFGRGRHPAWTGRIGERPVLALAGGMGKANAAHSLTTVLEHTTAEAVVGFGVGGAYPGSGLDVGDLAIASVEVYGDEGVLTPAGWMSCEGIGIPLVEAEGRRLFNEFPSDAAIVERSGAALGTVGKRVKRGPFVTVSTCTGTTVRGRELAGRFGAICETMEGAAYAHVAALYELPYLGLRGISNLVEDRNLESWRLGEAAAVAAEGVADVVTRWSPAATPAAGRMEGEA